MDPMQMANLVADWLSEAELVEHYVSREVAQDVRLLKDRAIHFLDAVGQVELLRREERDPEQLRRLEEEFKAIRQLAMKIGLGSENRPGAGGR
jgi:hypothetical protein